MHICSFSHTTDLSDLRARDRTPENVMKILRRNGKFSVFEATCNPKIAGIMTALCKDRVKTDHESMGFPWTVVVKIDGELLEARN